MDDKLKLLVISDLHTITNQENETDSHLFFSKGTSTYGDNFIEYALKLNQKFDILVCAGDIANQAHPDCFEAGWEFINRVKDELGIGELLCVPGNHDHQSRPTPKKTAKKTFDPKKTLQFARPSFPSNCSEKNTDFWAWNWCKLESNKYNAILLNTSAYHGFDDEYRHGRVDLKVVDQICNFVNTDDFLPKPLNLLVCHHHPLKMEHVDIDEDYESMEGGSYLLHKLHQLNKGAWLIIHGHKHFADITYAPAPGRNPPVIFAAGSLSGKLYPKILDRTANQFYIIDVDLNKSAKDGAPVGIFETHECLTGTRWAESTSSNLPSRGGFGGQHTPLFVANEIGRAITDESPFLDSSELAPFFHLTENFTPSDFRRLIEILENDGLSVHMHNNIIIEVGRPYD